MCLGKKGHKNAVFGTISSIYDFWSIPLGRGQAWREGEARGAIFPGPEVILGARGIRTVKIINQK